MTIFALVGIPTCEAVAHTLKCDTDTLCKAKMLNLMGVFFNKVCDFPVRDLKHANTPSCLIWLVCGQSFYSPEVSLRKVATCGRSFYVHKMIV